MTKIIKNHPIIIFRVVIKYETNFHTKEQAFLRYLSNAMSQLLCCT